MNLAFQMTNVGVLADVLRRNPPYGDANLMFDGV
jgi:hypothetical protein